MEQSEGFKQLIVSYDEPVYGRQDTTVMDFEYIPRVGDSFKYQQEFYEVIRIVHLPVQKDEYNLTNTIRIPQTAIEARRHP